LSDLDAVIAGLRLLQSCTPWSEHHFDVFDGGRGVRRIYRLDDGPDNSVVPGRVVSTDRRESYRHAPTLDDVKAAF
jgi:hypothetical protein